MLWIIVAVLLILWLLGWNFAYATVGVFVHLLLIIAIAVVLIRLIQVRNPT